jgi:hypothetical protein
MVMVRRFPLVYLVCGVLFVLVLVPALIAALPRRGTPTVPCASCDGTGWHPAPGSVCGCELRKCDSCGGNGGWLSIPDFVDRYGRAVQEGREAVGSWASENPWDTVVLGGALGVVIGAARRFRKAACGACRATGRLRLEVAPPDGTSSTVDVGCPFCGG